MVDLKLRREAWKLAKNIKVVSRLGRDGMGMVDNLLNMLKGIQYSLGLAENELEVPGGVLDEDFEQGLQSVLTKLDSIMSGEELDMTRAIEVSIALEPLLNWVNSGRRLVTSNDNSSGTKDREEIIRMIIGSGEDQRLSIFPILGMPGTGKTTLAQHVYHDTRVYEHFSVRHWVSMFNTDGTCSKLLDLVFRRQTSDVEILSTFRSIVRGKRYLLVLDGVTDDSVVGETIQSLLHDVGQGSKIVLTTSTRVTLEKLAPLPMSIGAPYEMVHLSEHEAKILFEHIALKEGNDERNLIISKIGLKICKMYASVPLLIKNVATLVSSKVDLDEHEYAPLETILLRLNLNIYTQLPSNIQQCVKFCSLFPVDYQFNKADLIHLWVAQAWLTENKRPEELVGNEYFEKLQNSGYFFHDTRSDISDAKISHEMHYLVKEFVTFVAKDKFHLAAEPIESIDYNSILHLSFICSSTWKAPLQLLNAKQLMSLLFLPHKPCDFATISEINDILTHLKALRALDLVAVNCETLPDSLGELPNLKYLRLGCSGELLPECIVKLLNLQTLDLRQSRVRELPNEFYKLSNLRHFYTGDRLHGLSPSFDLLKSLQTLDVFIVGKNNGFKALEHLKHLVGTIKIRYNEDRENEAPRNTAEVLKDKYLTDLSIIWSSRYDEAAADNFDFILPPPTLRCLEIRQCKSMMFPQRVINEFSSLQSLVSVHIQDCHRCNYLPAFSSLPHLKFIMLWNLKALEYIETVGDSTSTEAYFPSLETLTLAKLPKLRGWSHFPRQYLEKPHFPRLAVLKISDCPIVFSMPATPGLQSLEVENINEKLLKHLLCAPEGLESSQISMLKKLQITSVPQLVSLSVIQSSLESLKIRRCPQLETLVVEPFTYLQHFEAHECRRLMNITGVAMKHLYVNWKLGTVTSSSELWSA